VRLLLDEMFPSDAARQLHHDFGHDAVHVDDLGLTGADDQQVAEVARAEGRAVVTENVADYAAERDLVLVCGLKRSLPARGAQASALAEHLDRWIRNNPRPYVGQHWPG
jgi:predicted nuclease of predicted toxin-antitoxin system